VARPPGRCVVRGPGRAGVVADYRLDPPGPRLVLHDVMRAFLRMRRNAAARAEAHARLVQAAAAQLSAQDGTVSSP
jgi:hypothetical protein